MWRVGEEMILFNEPFDPHNGVAFFNIDREVWEIVSVEQFTGLHDKNGKEIYEGDVCDGHSDGYGVIKWTDFDGGYNYEFADTNVVGMYEVLKELKIIGNIYENPELLKS